MFYSKNKKRIKSYKEKFSIERPFSGWFKKVVIIYLCLFIVPIYFPLHMAHYVATYFRLARSMKVPFFTLMMIFTVFNEAKIMINSTYVGLMDQWTDKEPLKWER